ncbi:MAG: hypothetical protein AABX25_03645 [Nanoarchaeota archaeon]
MVVTYGEISSALANTINYYSNPSAPYSLIARESSLCQALKSMFPTNIQAFYGVGYPFWTYYTLNGTNPELQRELARHVTEFKVLADSRSPQEEHHCLTKVGKLRLKSPFAEGIDLRTQDYDSCSHCSPNLYQLGYVVPDGDLYIIVERFPTEAETRLTELTGASMGFLPLYRGLEEVVSSFASKDSMPHLTFDYVFVRKGDFIRQLSSGIEWPALMVPCMILRYGTDSFRENWLDLGADMINNLQPFIQYDPEVKFAFDSYLMRVFSKQNAGHFLGVLNRNGASVKFQRLFSIETVQDSFRMRHGLGREGRIEDLVAVPEEELVLK